MARKVRYSKSQYSKSPYNLDDLERIPEDDRWFACGVREDFRRKFKANGGFSPDQHKAIRFSLEAARRRSEALVPPITLNVLLGSSTRQCEGPTTDKTPVDTEAETKAETETKKEKEITMTDKTEKTPKKAILLDPDNLTGKQLQSLKDSLRAKYQYTPAAKKSGIVEKINGSWRETCLRHGQGKRKDDVVRKAEIVHLFDGKYLRISTIILAHFLKTGDFKSQEAIRDLISKGFDLSPYNESNGRSPKVLGDVIDLDGWNF